MNRSETLGKLSLALSKAQFQIKGAKKDSINPHFKTAYANLESVWDACREPLSNNELSIIQTIGRDETGIIFITTLLTHSSGEWISSSIPLLMGTRQDMQALGSAITYGRRYGLSSMIGVCPEEEDDGESLMERNKTRPLPRPKSIREIITTEYARLTDSGRNVAIAEKMKLIWGSLKEADDQKLNIIYDQWIKLKPEDITAMEVR